MCRARRLTAPFRIFAAGAFALPVGFLALMGWIPEQRVSGAVFYDKWNDNKGIFGMAMGLGCIAISLALITIYAPGIFKLTVSIAVACLLTLAALYTLPREIGRAAVFLFLADILQVNLSGALHYFFTATREEYPDGPHFTYTFYTTWSSLLAAFFGMVGLLIFQWKLKTWKIRNIFYLTTFLRVIASIHDVVLVKRWNRDVLHIPDKAFFLIGDAVISPVISMMSFMPMVVLISKLCKEGTESTTYSILASFQNL